MKFTVINQTQSLLNLQRIYFSCGTYKELYSKVVYIRLDENKGFICKVSSKPTVSIGNCLIDRTVQCSGSGDFKNFSFQNVEITEVENIEHLRKVTLNIVFKTIWDREKWINNNLFKLVKQILQLLIISNKCVVNVSDLKEFKSLGISFIDILSIGLDEGVGKVVNSTKIKINKCMCIEHYLVTKCEKSTVEFLKKPYDELNKVFLSRSKVLNSNSLPFLQVLLIGPAGCGKKSLIHQISNNTSSVLITIECSDISVPEPGESESLLKKEFHYAAILSKECSVVIQLLRLEAIGCQYGRILLQLNSLLDEVMCNSNIIVLAPISNPNSLQPSLRARFLHQIFIGPPTEIERAQILTALCRDLCVNDPKLMKDISKFTPGFVLSDLALLVNRVKRHLSSNRQDIVSKDLFKKYASLIEPSALRGELGLVKNNQEIAEIGGLASVKKSLFQLIQWPLLHSQAFKQLNIRPPSGILLYGPPGCAKTSLVRAAASESNITFFAVSAADLYSPYVGDAEQTICGLFQRARAAAPSILFIDEIDALVGCRDGRQKGAQERVLSAFLTEMDGVGIRLSSGTTSSDAKVMLIAATNRPNVLDSALLRPGRLDRLIHVPLPDYHDRIDILRVLCRKIPLSNCVDLEEIARKTERFTGADLANLCREAALQALTIDGIHVEIVQHKHFSSVLTDMKPSLTIDKLKWFEDFKFS